jgi:hypothetical protein
MQPIYPDTWELANAVQAHGAKLQPISWGNQEKHRYLLPGRPDGRPDGGRSSLACAALDAELDSTSRRRTRQLRKMQFISELLSERQVDSSLIVWYTSRRRVGPCRHRGWSISRRVVSLGEHLQPHAGRSPRNSGGTTATECLVGSEFLWPVLGGGGQARLLRPRRRGWWARTAGQGPTCACATEVGLGPCGLSEGGRSTPARAGAFPDCRNHMEVRGLGPEERVWFREGCLSGSTWRVMWIRLRSCVGRLFGPMP